MKEKYTKKQKELFNRIRDRNLFWSYSKDIQLESEQHERLLIERVLRFGEVDDLADLLSNFEFEKIIDVFENIVSKDLRYINHNLFIGRYVLGLDIDEEWLKEKAREGRFGKNFEKLLK